MINKLSILPSPNPSSGLAALRELFGPRNLLGALSAMQRQLGYIFRMRLPGFSPVFLSGPTATRFALTAGRTDLRWRNESDPVTSLLRHGLLVEDGKRHDSLRRQVSIVLQDVFLFNGSVRDNILFGRPEANEQEVIAAARTSA